MDSTDISDEQIAATILHKLARKDKWGGAHISSDKVSRWIALKIRNDGKRVGKVMKRLINRGFIIPKPTSYGMQISLNPHMSKVILQMIDRSLYSENEADSD